MFKNYLIVAVRNFMRYKVFSLINAVGLGIGVGCCILAVAFVQYELSWDRFHHNGDRIFRVLWTTPAQERVIEGTSGPLGPALKTTFPEVEEAVRVTGERVWVRIDQSAFQEFIGVADPSIFDVFTFSFLAGDAETVLHDRYSVAVTFSAAKRWFGDEDPIGRTIAIESRMFGGDYVVTGVLKDLPQNSSRPLRFDLLTNTHIGSESIKIKEAREEADWTWNDWLTTAAGGRGLQTFILLREGADAHAMVGKLPAFLRQNMGDEMASKHAYNLQPLKDIRLFGAKYGIGSGGDIAELYQIGGIAVLILLIACINFVNLSTARAGTRQREVGVRKAAGAHRGNLFAQFMVESLITTAGGLVVGLLFAQMALPLFRNHSGRSLPDDLTLLSDVLSVLPVVGLIVALLAGFYPALVLSSFDPVRALKFTSQMDVGGGLFRKGLVLWQFVVCILLIVGTIVMYKQTNFLKKKHLGFDRELIITMPIFSRDRDRKADWAQHLSYRYPSVKAAVLRHPHIVKASAYRWPPGVHGGITRVIEADGKMIHIRVIEGDEDFLDLFNIPLVAGRNFNPASLYSDSREFLINESALKFLAWDDPLGKPFNWRELRAKDATVVGVVRDFHTQRLNQQIEPMAIYYNATLLSHLGVKVKPDRTDETLAILKDTWEQFLPERPFEYAFLDDQIDALYRREEQTTRLMGAFSLLGILLGCLGLFGLIYFTAERRRKEIGIRKVLGAKAWDIVYRLSRESILVVVAANVIAWPVGFYLLQEWLNQFAYRIDLDVAYFALAGGIALLIALMTVGYQALRAAHANPVDLLRDE